ncbi:hypothetical protein [Bordetella bronchiseptica]|uniref:hypothetical protein n=1 Tax=Bordetella bronchiseptica TaxID=518 RepID=UPI000529183E|nr:hypothetical protein [Bordetella bronchiseptica]
MTRKREVLATEDISDLPPPSHRHPMSGEPIWDQHAVRAMLSKLRSPAPAPQDFVATELRGIIEVCGDSPTAIVSVERMRVWLSKLRAPVADERAALQKLVDLEDMRLRLRNLHEMGHGTDYDYYHKALPAARDAARAALASAPKPDERTDDAMTLLGKYKALCIEIGRGDSYHLGKIDAAIAALASVPIAGEAQPADLNTRLFEAAIRDLAAISEHLGLDPDEGGAEPIIEAIDELRRERNEWVDAGYAAAASAAPQASAEAVDLPGIDADRLRTIAASGSQAAMSNALLNVARALKQPQAAKDGGQQRAAFDHPVFAFLLGEGQLHGVDFGERAPGAVGKWWWRKDLRAALSATQPEQGERDA